MIQICGHGNLCLDGERESVSRWGEEEHENWKRRISRVHIGRIIYADAEIFVNYERKAGKQRVFFRFI